MSETDKSVEMDRFLDWAASASNIFERPTIRHLQDGETSIFRSTVQIKESFLSSKKPVFGTGRGFLASTSLLKAYAEALERFAMMSLAGGLGADTRCIHGDDAEQSPRLPSQLMTSNGWAVHFDIDSAKERALQEALERHLLQLSFYKEGWQAFELVKTEIFNGYLQEIFISKYTVLGHKAGLVKTKSKAHLGHTYGYFAAQLENFTRQLWLHGKLESIEPLLLFDSMDENQVRAIWDASDDFIEKNQLGILLRDEHVFKVDQPYEQINFEFPNNEKIFVTEINFKSLLQLPFDFYAAHVFSPALFTLTPPVLNRESISWISKTLDLYKISLDSFKDLNRYVPIY